MFLNYSCGVMLCDSENLHDRNSLKTIEQIVLINSLTLQQLGNFFQNVILCNIICYNCDICVWDWSNAMNIISALWLLMAWCFSISSYSGEYTPMRFQSFMGWALDQLIRKCRIMFMKNVYIQDPDFVIIMASNILTPEWASPSADAVMTVQNVQN